MAIFAVAAAIRLLTPAAAAAQGWLEPVTAAPHHAVAGRGHDLPLLPMSTDVEITVEGMQRVARFRVDFEFVNRSGSLLEADLFVPLPPGAVFERLTLYDGDRELAGEMLPAAAARAIYERIVRQRRDPGLVELAGHGLLRARVFPLEPRAERRVTLRYSQILERTGDALRLLYRRAAGPARHGPAAVSGRSGGAGTAGRPPRHGSTQSPHREGRFIPAEAAGDLSIAISLTPASMFATPYSPSHSIDRSWSDEDTLEVRVSDTTPTRETRDFQLFLPLHTGVAGLVGASLVTHPAGDGGYFMLLLNPPPAPADGTPVARDLTLVLDTSGSMAGDKITQARAALAGLLGTLRPTDRFRLLTFSSEVRELAPDLLPASANNIERALHQLHALEADGNTNLTGALQSALAHETRSDRLSVIALLTDGKPTIGEKDPERIGELAAALRDGERVFSFGIGRDVNTYLLERLVHEGRGASTYIRADEDIEPVVAALARKISSPALTDLEIIGAPATLEEIYPRSVPDLFHGEELVLVGRYRLDGSGADAGNGELRIGARRGDRPVQLAYSVSFDQNDSERRNSFLPRLWAARKAGALSAEIRVSGRRPDLVAELRDLALRYGVLTDMTSYLVEEPHGRALPSAAMVPHAGEGESAADATGALAFRAAAQSSELRAVNDIASLNESARKALAARASTTSPSPPRGRTQSGLQEGDQDTASTILVAGRWFRDSAAGWVDVAHESDDPIARLRAFGDGWFELSEELPALRPFLRLGERVKIAGRGLTLEIHPDGPERLNAKDLDRVVAAFGSAW